MKKMKGHIQLWATCLVALFMTTMVHGQESDVHGLITISGTVKDGDNNQKLEYVHIIAQGNNLATITNTNGKFTLKADSSYFPLTLEFLHIGYKKNRIQVAANLKEELVIQMKPHSYLLDEAIILPNDARFIVEQAIQNIAHNYLTVPSLLKGFYRETVQKRKKYINLSEAVTHTYKTSYTTGDAAKDKVEVVKSRRLISHKATDTLAVKLSGGPVLSIWLDIVKNPEILLAQEILDGYHFTLASPETINGKLAYVIHFRPTGQVPYALYEGKLYINPINLSFIRAEFNLSLKNKAEATPMILSRKPAGLHFNLLEASYIISYREQNGKTVQNYIRNRIRFKCDWKRKLFGTNYTIQSENIVTDWEEIPSFQLPRDRAYPKNKAIYDSAPANWSADFWKEYNILEPDESLEKAVRKLKKENKSK